jgi:hypothetical protein
MKSPSVVKLIVGLVIAALPLVAVAGDGKSKDGGQGFMQGLDSVLKGVGDGVRSAGEAVGKGAKDASKEIDKSAAEARKSTLGDKR